MLFAVVFIFKISVRTRFVRQSMPHLILLTLHMTAAKNTI